MGISFNNVAVGSNGPNYEETISLVKDYIKNNRLNKKEEDLMRFFSHFGYNNNLYKTLDKVFGDNDRLTWTYVESNNDEYKSSYDYELVEDKLRPQYKIEDFIKGTCKKEGDSRVFKIGKVLSNICPETQKVFNNSVFRNSSKKKLCATLSRNAYDIMMMSTGRGWRSCMASDGGNFHYVGADMMFGTLIIYFHEEDDKDIKNPSGRILLKPFISSLDDTPFVFYKQEGDTYGSLPPESKEIIKELTSYSNNKIINKNQNKIITGKRIDLIYNDGVGYDHAIINIDYDNLENVDLSDLKEDYFFEIIRNLPDKYQSLSNHFLIGYLDVSSYSYEYSQGLLSNEIEDHAKYIQRNKNDESIIKFLVRVSRTGIIEGEELYILLGQLTKYKENIFDNFNFHDIRRLKIAEKYKEKLFKNNPAMTYINLNKITDENQNYEPKGNINFDAIMQLGLDIETNSPLYKEILLAIKNGNISLHSTIKFYILDDVLNLPIMSQLICYEYLCDRYSNDYCSAILENIKSHVDDDIDHRSVYNASESVRAAYYNLGYPNIKLPVKMKNKFYNF